jgi:hypothetical protein
MKRINPVRLSARILRVSQVASIIAIACLISLSNAHAEVHLSGSGESVTVHATNASLADVIVAVELVLGVKITITPAINFPVFGTYSGSLRSVLGRLLSGHNYILGTSGDRITIILL